jgi:hypothetical protein
MDDKSFGYDPKIPEQLKEISMWLCQDIASLQGKWDLYLGLFDNKDNFNLFNYLAPMAFGIIEESLGNDIIMAIGRLGDPKISLKKENLSLATLVEKCTEIADLGNRLKTFQSTCSPVKQWRNKRIGHRDLETTIRPIENPLPIVNRLIIDEILLEASGIIKTIYFHYSGADVNFHTIGRGNADDLLFWLRAGQEHYFQKLNNTTKNEE